MITGKTSAGILLAILGASAAHGIDFTIGGRTQAQQLAQVESNADLETFTGRTDGVTGKISFDPKKRTGSGSITIDAKSIDTGIPLRNDHMQSAGWLDTAKYPTITFVTSKVAKGKTADTYTVTGKFTLHGVTKTIKVPVSVKYLKASQNTAKSGFKGDVLQIKTSFSVKMSDYGIKIPAMAASKVSDTVRISVTAYGQSG